MHSALQNRKWQIKKNRLYSALDSANPVLILAPSIFLKFHFFFGFQNTAMPLPMLEVVVALDEESNAKEEAF